MEKTTAPKTIGVGWDVFTNCDSSDGERQIQQIDNPVDYDDPAFGFVDGDLQAIKHVIKLAKAGDDEAIDALWEVLPYDGLVNRVFWAEHFPHFGTEFPI